MAETRFRVEVPGKGPVSAIRAGREAAPVLFVYAPGAGAGVNDPFGAFLAEQLAEIGLGCVRFQFPYREAGRSGPDRPDVLEATWQAVIDTVRPAGGALVIGGRSMGGRIASQVVARRAAADALVLFAYPLHPIGQPERLRDAHLPDIAIPTLFCSGTKDAFGTPEELRAAVLRTPKGRLHLMEGADHGFAGAKGSGRTRREIWREALEAALAFVAGELPQR